MIYPPQYPDYVEPGKPHWRRWWLALLLLWGGQSALLMALWPEHRPRVELWLWSAVLPLLWALALALRYLVWQIGLGNREAYRGVIDTALQRWWRARSRGLPVEQVLLFGPEGEQQSYYTRLMTGTAPLPSPQVPSPGAPTVLRCPLSTNLTSQRAPLIAQHLAHMLLAQSGMRARWSHLRGLAWHGTAESYQAFASVLRAAGVSLPEQALPLVDLPTLDWLIDGFPRLCPEEEHWLLCAGVASVEQAAAERLAGEAGFAWLVSHAPVSQLKRGEYLQADQGERAAELCAQMQRYANLDAAPAACLAMDAESLGAFAEGGWPANEHLLAAYWGVLDNLAPFIGMSVALLHSAGTGQACGWLSRDGENRLAMGVAVPHGKGK
ncbi:hypothetical protein [Pseudomonas sp. EggHat1]|uniref:hypothetical protein n=1 Tax=Pseudomonas sp. EggHat1 TaxID=2761624 RepID=UPI00299F6DBB|nr:hypothetical protein [Pseudomonas sp. EggHat1]